MEYFSITKLLTAKAPSISRTEDAKGLLENGLEKYEFVLLLYSGSKSDGVRSPGHMHSSSKFCLDASLCCL